MHVYTTRTIFTETAGKQSDDHNDTSIKIDKYEYDIRPGNLAIVLSQGEGGDGTEVLRVRVIQRTVEDGKFLQYPYAFAMCDRCVTSRQLQVPR